MYIEKVLLVLADLCGFWDELKFHFFNNNCYNQVTLDKAQFCSISLIFFIKDPHILLGGEKMYFSHCRPFGVY